MKVYLTNSEGTDYKEQDMVFVFRAFSKNLVTDDIHFIRDREHGVMWFCPAEFYLETLQMLLKKFYQVTQISNRDISGLIKSLTVNLEFFNDSSGRKLIDYLRLLATNS